MRKKHLLVISILVLIFFSFHSNNFRIDASSDTLVAQNDEDFKFFNSYNNIFPSRNFLVLAIKSDKEIDDKYIKVIENLSKDLIKLQEIESVFSINHAPILFLNKTSLLDLSNQKIETILNTNFELKEIINEFSSSSILKDQIINSNKNISSIIIYLKKNQEFIKYKNENKNSQSFETKKKYVASQQNWKCAKCTQQLSATFEVNHKIDLQFGGTNHVNNLEALCRNCHGEKTMLNHL